MPPNLPLSSDKKLIILCRVEPGCLGPDGKSHIDAFCTYAQQVFKQVEPNIIHWQIVPRYDKTLPEIQYTIANKALSFEQARRYLTLYDKHLEVYEEFLNEKLTKLIESYLDQK